MKRAKSAYYGVAAQLGCVMAGMVWLLVAPPSRGFVLLIPLSAEARPAAAAVAQNMRIVSGAPIASVVARAATRYDAGALLRQGILPIAAPRTWCGSASDGGVA